MKKKQFRKSFRFLTVLIFIFMMGLSIFTTNQGNKFSIAGYMALASGNTGGNCSPGSEPGGPCCALWDIEYIPGQPTRCYLGGSYYCYSKC